MKYTREENLAYAKKVRQRIARANNSALAAKERIEDVRAREDAYLAQHPHLKDQRWCGLCLEDGDAPRRKVVCPNGVVLYTSWYKVPTTEADGRRAMKEQDWLCSKEGKEFYQATFL